MVRSYPQLEEKKLLRCYLGDVKNMLSKNLFYLLVHNKTTWPRDVALGFYSGRTQYMTFKIVCFSHERSRRFKMNANHESKLSDKIIFIESVIRVNRNSLSYQGWTSAYVLCKLFKIQWFLSFYKYI